MFANIWPNRCVFRKQLVASRPHRFRRHQQQRNSTNKHSRTRQIQRTIQIVLQEHGRNQWSYYAEQASPEACNSACSASDRRRVRFGRPTIENGVEHTLEEVFHGVEADVRTLCVYCREKKEGDAHQRRRAHHSPFAPNTRDSVHQRAKKDTWHAANIDDNEVSVSLCNRDGNGAILQK